MRVLIVKNEPEEGPGLLEEVLKEHSIDYDTVDMEKGDAFPHPRDFSAVVVLGGPDSANDTTERMKAEINKIKEILNAGIPYLGICLGMQVLVKAAGGKVYKHSVPEIGWRDPDGNLFEIQSTRDGKKDPLLKGLPLKLKIFQLHGETVQLIGAMKLLATGKHCQNQVIRVGKNAYGIQGHFELTGEMFEMWIAHDPDLKKMDKDALRKDYNAIKSDYETNGRRIAENFLKIAKIIP
ncbi:type 1 glutamine amidotransferase [Candidatus Woesearchaeota archaeon]|nr:type 1 glutamine amidotransferase [Candidatus Woesearchaeota archaeon]